MAAGMPTRQRAVDTRRTCKQPEVAQEGRSCSSGSCSCACVPRLEDGCGTSASASCLVKVPVGLGHTVYGMTRQHVTPGRTAHLARELRILDERQERRLEGR